MSYPRLSEGVQTSGGAAVAWVKISQSGGMVFPVVGGLDRAAGIIESGNLLFFCLFARLVVYK